MRHKIEVREGYEIRGFVVRLYPDQDQELRLKQLEDRMRYIWNVLVKQVEDAIDANRAYAVRRGIVPQPPARPDYRGLDPDESRLAKRSFAAAMGAWGQSAYLATKDLPGCKFRQFKDVLAYYDARHDYQYLKQIGRWASQDGRGECDLSAHLLQSLAKNYFARSAGARRKRFKKSRDSMPIQTRSCSCFELGEFGIRGNGRRNFYDCRVNIAGLRIRGRLPGRAPLGRVLEGVSIKRAADGWYAAIKQEMPKRALPPPIPGTIIGVDVGRDFIAAFSDGQRVRNHRGAVYAQRIAGLQSENKSTGRMQQSAARHNRHVIYNEVIKPLELVETIAIEDLSPGVTALGGSVKVSSMRTIAALIKERYGDRVREVPCAYTSQDCSQCGTRSKESWSYEHGRRGNCPSCGYSEDRDINAARNIAAKAAKSVTV